MEEIISVRREERFLPFIFTLLKTQFHPSANRNIVFFFIFFLSILYLTDEEGESGLREVSDKMAFCVIRSQGVNWYVTDSYDSDVCFRELSYLLPQFVDKEACTSISE